jgi:hypothetical protein
MSSGGILILGHAQARLDSAAVHIGHTLCDFGQPFGRVESPERPLGVSQRLPDDRGRP